MQFILKTVTSEVYFWYIKKNQFFSRKPKHSSSKRWLRKQKAWKKKQAVQVIGAHGKIENRIIVQRIEISLEAITFIISGDFIEDLIYKNDHIMIAIINLCHLNESYWMYRFKWNYFIKP